MPLSTTVDRFVSQWADATRLRTLGQIWLDTLRTEIVEPTEAIQAQRSLETAEGVYLDRIGDLLGCPRPALAVASDQSDVFGYDGAGVGFDQGRMADESGFGDPVEPIADAIYRPMLRARRTTILGDGSVESLETAARHIDASATVEDGFDMTVTITTTMKPVMDLAVKCRAVGAPAGVTLTVSEA